MANIPSPRSSGLSHSLTGYAREQSKDDTTFYVVLLKKRFIKALEVLIDLCRDNSNGTGGKAISRGNNDETHFLHKSPSKTPEKRGTPGDTSPLPLIPPVGLGCSWQD